MVQISETDWKLFRQRLPGWQEHYMEQLVKEYIKLLSSPAKASDRFWELEKRIRQDRKHPGVILEMKRSNAIWNIAGLVGYEVITMEDLKGFSQDLISGIELILRRNS